MDGEVRIKVFFGFDSIFPLGSCNPVLHAKRSEIIRFKISNILMRESIINERGLFKEFF
jgi:hypothetical protein